MHAPCPSDCALYLRLLRDRYPNPRGLGEIEVRECAECGATFHSLILNRKPVSAA